jgi:hypothetical protein
VPNPISAARQLIQSRLVELDAEASSLRKALASLGERPAPRRRPGRPKAASAAPAKSKPRAAGKRKNSKRAPRGQRREQLLGAIKANPGARPADLAREIGISANQVHVLIARAKAEKLIITRGKGYAVKA